jgi:hypothetical protein
MRGWTYHNSREEYRRESDQWDRLPHVLPEGLWRHAAAEEGQLAVVFLPLFIHFEERRVLLVDSELCHSGTLAVVRCLDDEEVHADQDGNEDQGGDTKGSFKGDILDDCAGDCLTMQLLEGILRNGVKSIPKKYTRSKHHAPDADACSSLVDKVHIRHGGRDKGL